MSFRLPFKCCVFLALCLGAWVPGTVAEQRDSEPSSSVLEIGVSMSIPPWVIKDDDSGIELDLLRAALEPYGYQITPVYLPFALAHNMFDAGELDGVLNAKPDVAKSGYFTDPVVTFQNVAISLASKAFPVDITFDFMSDKSIVAFQKAKEFLGPDFGSMAARNESYEEISKQALQVNLLFIREVDFIVLDKSIFGYYWKEALNQDGITRERKQQYLKPIRFHRIFEPTKYAFVFQSKKVRDNFNDGLERLHETGQYKAILQKYDRLTDLYREVARDRY